MLSGIKDPSTIASLIIPFHQHSAPVKRKDVKLQGEMAGMQSPSLVMTRGRN